MNASRLIAIAVICFLPASALASIGGELLEWMAKQGARYADDVASVTKSQLDDLARHAGDDAVEQMVKQGGPGATRLVLGFGDDAADAARVIARQGSQGRFVLEQGGTRTLSYITEYGDECVDLFAREGTDRASRLLSTYGKSIVPHIDSAGSHALSKESLTHLRAWSETVEQASPTAKAKFTEKLAQGGDDFVVWAHRRWKEIAITGGLSVGLISAYKVGDGIADALPNPADDPAGWIAWWLPALIAVAIVAIAWFARHAFSSWMAARKKPLVQCSDKSHSQ